MLLLYLRRHYKVILMFALFTGIFALVFSLYDLPVEAVGYAALLCAATGAVLFAIGYSRYVRRHRELQWLQKRVTVSLEELPRPSGLLERDYQDLLRILGESASAARDKAERERRDMVDYYTLWVHQIKTPISAMRLLLQPSVGPESAAMSAELFRVEQYVEMVLSYIRLDSESTDFVLREYKLDDIVRQAVRKYARLFILKKLPLDFRESGLTVLTDEKWLLFVIEQLLSNAVKYTSRGQITIYCEGTTLVIADTGIGIREEDIPRVFESGFTGYNGRADKKSTGLGLGLCRRVCDKLGHRISIESQLGVGTQARVSLGRGARVVE